VLLLALVGVVLTGVVPLDLLVLGVEVFVDVGVGIVPMAVDVAVDVASGEVTGGNVVGVVVALSTALPLGVATVVCAVARESTEPSKKITAPVMAMAKMTLRSMGRRIAFIRVRYRKMTGKCILNITAGLV
jgi:hypothetical protein